MKNLPIGSKCTRENTIKDHLKIRATTLIHRNHNDPIWHVLIASKTWPPYWWNAHIHTSLHARYLPDRLRGYRWVYGGIKLLHSRYFPTTFLVVILSSNVVTLAPNMQHACGGCVLYFVYFLCVVCIWLFVPEFLHIIRVGAHHRHPHGKTTRRHYTQPARGRETPCRDYLRFFPQCYRCEADKLQRVPFSW